MTDERINGTAESITGQAKGRFGSLIGDQKLQLEGAFEDAKGRSLDTFGRAMDGLDGLVSRAPANIQPQARSAIEAARQRPLLTTLAVAGLGLLLAGAAGRRR